MKKFLIIFCCFFSIFTFAQNGIPPAAMPCLAADIIFIRDNSFSVNNMQAVQIDVVETVLERIPPEYRKIQYAMITFSDSLSLGIDMVLTSDASYIRSVITPLKKETYIQDGSFLAPSLRMALAMFRGSKNEYDHFKIIILMTDGIFNDPKEVEALVGRPFERENIIMFSLGFGDEKQDAYTIDPVSRTKIRNSSMNIDHNELKQISEYFENNSLRLVDAIGEKGKCL